MNSIVKEEVDDLDSSSIKQEIDDENFITFESTFDERSMKECSVKQENEDDENLISFETMNEKPMEDEPSCSKSYQTSLPYDFSTSPVEEFRESHTGTVSGAGSTRMFEKESNNDSDFFFDVDYEFQQPVDLRRFRHSTKKKLILEEMRNEKRAFRLYSQNQYKKNRTLDEACRSTVVNELSVREVIASYGFKTFLELKKQKDEEQERLNRVEPTFELRQENELLMWREVEAVAHNTEESQEKKEEIPRLPSQHGKKYRRYEKLAADRARKRAARLRETPEQRLRRQKANAAQMKRNRRVTPRSTRRDRLRRIASKGKGRPSEGTMPIDIKKKHGEERLDINKGLN